MGSIGRHCALAMLGLVGLVAVDDLCVAASDGPSFDCRKAIGWAETAICTNAGLAALDRRMAEVYGRVSAGTAEAERSRLIASQRAWISERDRCERLAAPLDCLRQSYNERLGLLADEENRLLTAAPLPPVIRSAFRCEDGRDLDVAFYTADPARVVIVAGRRTIELPQAASASGARYSDGVTTFWNKGDSAVFEWANGSTQCRARH